MTKEEFKIKINELIKELNFKGDRYNIFIMIGDTIDNSGESLGYGCSACMAEYIQECYEDGDFEHQKSSFSHKVM